MNKTLAIILAVSAFMLPAGAFAASALGLTFDSTTQWNDQVLTKFVDRQNGNVCYTVTTKEGSYTNAAISCVK